MTHALQSAFMWPRSWSRAVTCDPKLDVKNPQDCFRMLFLEESENAGLQVATNCNQPRQVLKKGESLPEKNVQGPSNFSPTLGN